MPIGCVKQIRRWTLRLVRASVLLCPLSAASAAATATGAVPQILTQDVDLFYRVYDAAGGRPSESQLQHDYIDVGSNGLHQFAQVRSLSGYWVGYRIVKSYYQHAQDKRTALRDIVQVKDAKALLAQSGWYPGILLQ